MRERQRGRSGAGGREDRREGPAERASRGPELPAGAVTSQHDPNHPPDPPDRSQPADRKPDRSQPPASTRLTRSPPDPTSTYTNVSHTRRRSHPPSSEATPAHSTPTAYGPRQPPLQAPRPDPADQDLRRARLLGPKFKGGGHRPAQCTRERIGECFRRDQGCGYIASGLTPRGRFMRTVLVSGHHSGTTGRSDASGRDGRSSCWTGHTGRTVSGGVLHGPLAASRHRPSARGIATASPRSRARRHGPTPPSPPAWHASQVSLCSLHGG